MSSDSKVSAGLLRLDSLQILRAIAAFAVLVFHLGDSLVRDFGMFATNPFEIGAHGVDMFFVISGFIICYASKDSSSSIEFAKKRIFRIRPLYYLLTFGVFAIALVAPQLLNSTEANFVNLAKSLAFIPYEAANGLVQPLLFLGWTLNFEMFFYLLFAICIGLRHREIVVGLVVVAIALTGLWVDFGHVIPDFFSRSIILNFAWGVAVFLVYKHMPSLIAKLRWLWVPAAVFILMQLIWPIPLSGEFSIGIPSAFILLSVLPQNKISGPVGDGVKLIGDASYSLYLVHPYVIQACVKVIIPLLGGGILAIALLSVLSIIGSIVASVLLFKFVEKPSNLWLRKHFLNSSGKTLVGDQTAPSGV